jgi:hypothetical protein
LALPALDNLVEAFDGGPPYGSLLVVRRARRGHLAPLAGTGKGGAHVWLRCPFSPRSGDRPLTGTQPDGVVLYSGSGESTDIDEATHQPPMERQASVGRETQATVLGSPGNRYSPPPRATSCPTRADTPSSDTIPSAESHVVPGEGQTTTKLVLADLITKQPS